MHLSKLDDLEPFTTLDGSTIREIAGPAWTPARNQSLAQATVPVGARTDSPGGCAATRPTRSPSPPSAWTARARVARSPDLTVL